MGQRLAPEFLNEFLQREKAREGLEDYRTYISQAATPDFEYPPAAHHKLIQDALQSLVLNNDHDALLIMAPPGSAKSTYASIQFPTWAWAIFPDWKILAVSNTTNLAEDFARRRRNICELQEWRNISDTTLDKNQMGIAGFANTSGGVMYARGVGSSIAGLRANLLITDDAIASFEEAMSATQLDKIFEWYGTDARTRLVPDGKEVMITTRWSRQDPAGRILQRIEDGEEPKRWKIIRLPMLCDEPDTDPLNRQLDEPLWPEWFTDAQIQDNINHPLRWPALYQQVPVDASGTWVDPSYLQLIPPKELPKTLSYIIAVDLALSTGKGDYTAIVVAGIDKQRNIYIVEVHRHRLPIMDTYKKLSALTVQYTPTVVLIDDDPAAKVFIATVRELNKRDKQPIPLYPMPIAGNDKETRAAAIRTYFMSLRVFIVEAAWTPIVLKEIATFPPKSKTEHDDIIDDLSLIGRHLYKQSTPLEEKKPQEVEIKGGIHVNAEGNLVTSQTFDEIWQDNKPILSLSRSRRI